MSPEEAVEAARFNAEASSPLVHFHLIASQRQEQDQQHAIVSGGLQTSLSVTSLFRRSIIKAGVPFAVRGTSNPCTIGMSQSARFASKYQLHDSFTNLSNWELIGGVTWWMSLFQLVLKSVDTKDVKDDFIQK